jgi:hypothetical protein
MSINRLKVSSLDELQGVKSDGELVHVRRHDMYDRTAFVPMEGYGWIERIAAAMTDAPGYEKDVIAWREYLKASQEVLLVRAIRADIHACIAGGPPTPEQKRRLANLNRSERRAQTKRLNAHQSISDLAQERYYPVRRTH